MESKMNIQNLCTQSEIEPHAFEMLSTLAQYKLAYLTMKLKLCSLRSCRVYALQ